MLFLETSKLHQQEKLTLKKHQGMFRSLTLGVHPLHRRGSCLPSDLTN